MRESRDLNKIKVRRVQAFIGGCYSNSLTTACPDGAEGGGGNRNGRDHNPYGFSVWMAGVGMRGGKAIGATDDIGLRAVKDTATVHDVHATLLGLLGVDHKRLTYPFQGRDFRLTDVHGENDLTARLTKG